MLMHVDKGFTEVAYKITSDLPTLPFFDIVIFYILATTVLFVGVSGFFIYILTNEVLKNSIRSWSQLGLGQKGLAHLHNTDSSAASILQTLLQMHLFEKHVIMYILFPALFHLPSAWSEWPLSRTASICRIKRASKWKVTRFVAHQSAEYKEISRRCCLVHANADVLKFQHFFGFGFGLISWSHRLTTPLVPTPYVIRKG